MGKTIVMIAFLTINFSASATEKLIAVDRVGQTKSIQLHYIKESENNNFSKMPKRYTPEEIFGKMLPIHTPSMSPGYIEPKRLDYSHVIRPVFIIGSDKLSIQWLSKYKDILMQINAIGLLVEVETIEQLKIIGNLGKGLQIAPSSGEQIVQTLNIKHYPVLVTSDGVEQ